MCALVLAVVSTTSAGWAQIQLQAPRFQAPTLGAVAGGGTIHALTDPNSITFDQIYRAETQMWATMTQTRFAATLDPQTGVQDWTGLIEFLTIAPPVSGTPTSGTPAPGAPASSAHGGKPRFDLQLIIDLGLNPILEARQLQVHHQHRGFLQLHGGFRVQDPGLAAANYSIHYMASTFRIGRPVFRVAVLANDPTAHVWVLDLDVETGYPLSRSEHTPQGLLVSMINVLAFEHGANARAQIQAPDWWDAPLITDYATPSAARAAMVEQHKIRIPTVTPAGFELIGSSVIDEPLTGEQSLSLHYTDGIRSILQLQAAGVPPLDLSMLQTSGRGGQDVYSIIDFSDLTTSQLMFQVGDVRYLLIGSADSPSLDGFAVDLVRSRVRVR